MKQRARQARARRNYTEKRLLSITNVLLSLMILLGGVAATMINLTLVKVDTSVVSVVKSVNSLNVSAGEMGVRLDHLERGHELLETRVVDLEMRGYRAN